jgi:hypothetical protein
VSLATDSGISDEDALTNDATLTITAEPGSTVRVFDGDTLLGDATEGAPGEFTFTPTGLEDGTYTLTATATDAAGNVSEAGEIAFTLDTTAPDAPVVSLATDSGESNEDALTNDAALTITAEAGSTVRVFDGDTLLGFATETEGTPGEFTFTPTDLADGTYTLTATATDAAGNLSEAGEIAFTLDTTAPDAPGVSLATDSGISDEDALTNDAALTITAEPGSTVRVFDGDTLLGDATEGAPGEFTFTPTGLEDGTYTLTATATDAAGNVSEAGEIAFTLDTTAPDAPVVSLATDSGESNEDALTNDATLTITAEAGSTVRVFDGDTLLGFATETEGTPGEFTFTPTGLADGTYTLTATATDAAGNVSEAGEIAFTLDTTTPDAPVVSLTTDTGESNEDALTNDAALTITAEPGSTVRVFDGDTLLGDATETEGTPGEFTFTPTDLADGTYTLTATATDAAGNLSEAGEIAFTLDTTAPDAPGVSLATDSGISDEDALTNDAALTITAEPGSTVRVFDGDTLLGDATEGAPGEFTFTPTGLEDGTYTLTATATDAAGNVSEAGEIAFTLDTTAPDAPVVSLATDSGISDEDALTNDAALTITAEPGSTVRVFDGDTLLGDATEGAPGEFTFTPTGLEDGTYTLTATATDAAGNVSEAGEIAFTLDTTAPDAPVVSLATDSGESNEDALTNDAALTITAEAGSTVRVFDGDTLLGFATETEGTPGEFTFTPTDLADGTYTLTATATDAAGNVSEAGEIAFTLDTTAPDAPVVSLAIDSGIPADGVTNDGALTVPANIEPGATVEYRVLKPGDASFGDWSTTYTDPARNGTADGDYVVDVRQIDLAGNVSQVTRIEFRLDTVPPLAPEVSLTNDTGLPGDLVTSDASLTVSPVPSGATRTFSVNGGTPSETYVPPTEDGDYTVVVSDTDIAGNTAITTINFSLDITAPGAPDIRLSTDSGIPADGLTNDATLTIKAEAGSTVRVFDGDTELGVATEIEGTPGEFSFTPPTGLGDGTYTLTATATDAAGNVSDAGEVTFTLDTIAPVAPSLDAVTGNNVVNVLEAGSYTLTGRAEVGSTVSVAFSGLPNDPDRILTAVADETGRWTLSLDEDLATLPSEDPIPVGLRLTATDVAGNESAAREAAYTIDLRPAPAPEFTLPEGTIRIGQTATIEVKFVSTPLGLTIADFTASTGELSNLRAVDGSNGTLWLLDFTPSQNVEVSDIRVTIGTDWTSASGNPPAAETVSGTFSSISVFPITISRTANEDAIFVGSDALGKALSVAQAGDTIRILSGDFDATPLNATVALKGLEGIEIAAGAFLTISVDQADGVSIRAEGTDTGGLAVRIVGLDDRSVDLSQVTTAGNRVVAEVQGEVGLDAETVLGSVQLLLEDNSSLALSASQVTGRVVVGVGDITISGITAETDLSLVSNSGSASAELAPGSSIEFTGNFGRASVMVPGDATLGLLASEADGREFGGTGTVTIQGLEAALAADLSRIADTIQARAIAELSGDQSLSFTGDLGPVALDVSRTDTTSGNVFALGASVDGAASYAVGEGVTLVLSGSQVSGREVSGSGGLRIVDPVASTDLSDVSPDLFVTVALSATADLSENETLAVVGNFEIAAGVELTLPVSAVAAGQAVTGSGALTIVGLTEDANLSGLDEGLSAVTLRVTESVTFEGQLPDTTDGDIRIEVAEGATLTVSAAVITGATITGMGQVVVIGLEAFPAANLSGISVAGGFQAIVGPSNDPVELGGAFGSAEVVLLAGTSASFGPDAGIAGASFTIEGSLTASSDRVDGLEITVATSGELVIDGLTTGLDLSRLSVVGGGSVVGRLSGSLDISGSASYAGKIGAYDLSASTDVTFTLTAAQASGVAVGGAGAGDTIVVRNAAAAPAADLSGITGGNLVIRVASDLDAQQLTLPDPASRASLTFEVSADRTLTLDADVLADAIVTGAGTLVITGLLLAGFDASGLTVEALDLRAATLPDSLTLATQSTVTVAASQLGNVTLVGDDTENTLVIDVSGLYASGYDPDTDPPPVLSIESIDLLAGADRIELRGFPETNPEPQLIVSGPALFGAERAGDGNVIAIYGGVVDFGNVINFAEIQPNSGITLPGSVLAQVIDAFENFGGFTISGAGRLTVTEPAPFNVDLAKMNFIPGGTTVPTVILPSGELTDAGYQTDGGSIVLLPPEGTQVRIIDTGGTEIGGFDGSGSIANPTVFTAEQFLSALDSDTVTSIKLGDNITLNAPGEVIVDVPLTFDGKRLNIGADVSLTVDVSELVDAPRITGAGTLRITGVEQDDVAGLSGVTVTAATAVLADTASVTIDGGALQGVGIEVPLGATLRIAAADLEGRLITGSGTVEVELRAGDVAADLGVLSGDLTVTAVVTENLAFRGNFAGAEVRVEDEVTLTLRATEANGLVIEGPGNVTVTGLVNAPRDADFSGIDVGGVGRIFMDASLFRFDGTDAFGGDFGTLRIDFPDTGVFRAIGISPAGVADGVAMDGIGLVALYQLTSADAAADFSGIDVGRTSGYVSTALFVTETMTFTGKLPEGGYVGGFPGTGQEWVRVILEPGVTLTVAQSIVAEAQVFWQGNIVLTDLAPDANLSNIENWGGKRVLVSEQLELDGSANLASVRNIDLATGGELTLSAAQASGRVIAKLSDATDTRVTVTGISETPSADLGALTADLVTGVVDADVRFVGRIGSAELEVLEGATLTANAALLNGASVGGAGNVVIESLSRTPNADLSGVVVTGDKTAKVMSSFVFEGTLGDVSVELAPTAVLTLSADQATGRIFTGQGSLVVRSLRADSDLSDVAIGGNLFVSITETIDFKGTLPTGATLQLLGGNLTIAAEAISGLVVYGAGDVTISGLGPATDLSNVFTVGATLAITRDGTTDLTGANLGNFALDIPAGSIVTLTALQANGRTITGQGEVRIVGLQDVVGDDYADGIADSVTISIEKPLVSQVTIGTDGFVNAQNATEGVPVTGVVTDGLGGPITDGSVTVRWLDYVTVVLTNREGRFTADLPSEIVRTAVDGDYSLTIVAVRADRNPSDAEVASFVLDTIAPSDPILALSADTGRSASDRVTQDAALTISAEAGSFVQVFAGQTQLGIATERPDAPGIFDFVPAGLPDGVTTLTATARDAAGNLSAAGSLTFTLDTAAPSAPVAVLANDTGADASDGVTRTPTLTITAEAGSTVRVFVGQTELGTASERSGEPGIFDFVPSGLADGQVTLRVTATDAAGNLSDAGEVTFTLDTVAPVAPDVRLLTDSGASTTDGVTNDGALTSPANIEPGATVEYRVRKPGDAAFGDWNTTYIAPARDGTADGDYVVDVRQIDLAGNVSQATRIEFRLDTVPPLAPEVSLANDTGIPGDLVTSDASLTVSPVPAGATRTFSVNGGTPTGTYVPPTAFGSYTVVVADTDIAGNTASTTITFTLATDGRLVADITFLEPLFLPGLSEPGTLTDLIERTLFADGDDYFDDGGNLVVVSQDGTITATLIGDITWDTSGEDGPDPVAGTLSSVEFRTGVSPQSGGTLIATVTGLQIDAVALAQAVDADFDNGFGDRPAFDALFAPYAINFTGSAGDDTFEGSPNDDTLFGGAGDDFFLSSGGNDVIDGGEGFDAVSYQFEEGAVTVNLAEGTAFKPGGTDTLISIESVRGSMFDDTLIGDDNNNVFRPLAGNDTIDGGGGNNEVRYDRDVNFGGTQGVVVDLEAGTAIDGFGDTDTLINIQRVRGSQFDDILIGSSTQDNVLRGGGGADTFVYLGGNDVIADFQLGLDILDLSRLQLDEADLSAVFASAEDVGGGTRLNFSDGNSLTFAGLSVEQVQGLGPDGRLVADITFLEPLFLPGLSEPGTLTDLIERTLFADGDDYFDDGGNLVVVSQDGTITATLIGDIIWEESDDDLMPTSGTLSSVEFRTGVSPQSGGTLIATVTGLQIDAVALAQAVDADFDNGFGDRPAFDALFAPYAINFTGSAGDDTFEGSPNDDTLFGGAGDDFFLSSGGNDVIDGGEGFDAVSYQFEEGAVTVNLAEGTAFKPGGTDTLISIESVRGSMFDDTLIGDDNNNVFRPLAGNDTIDGGGGNNEVRYDRDVNFGGTQGVVVDLEAGTAIDGFGDTDTLINIQRVRGSQFDDILIGSSTQDNVLRGGGGADTFVYLGGNDVIADFQLGLDILDLSRLQLDEADLSAVFASAEDVGGGTRLNFSDGNSLTFAGLSVEQVQGLGPDGREVSRRFWGR